jgi:ornithine cyclodeaminase
MNLPYLDAAEVARRLDVLGAANALEAALRDGLDPEGDPPRTAVAVGDGGGELLVMPAAAGAHAAVKLVSVGGDPRIQGICVVFDGTTLAPAALIDGIALTNLRTPAVSVLAVRALAPGSPPPRRLVVFGRGPQGVAHADALRAAHPSIDHVDLVGSATPPGARDDLVAAADLVVCATTAREPLFDGARVGDHATVVAIGSHEPDARELDATLLRRAGIVVVESRASARREAGDVLLAGLRDDDVVTLAELIASGATSEPTGPRVFKSTGMAWEDAVVASALLRRNA